MITSHTLDSSATLDICSQEQAELSDIIDKLRQANLDGNFGVPHIVVCGDQSSGKSSVLQSISHLPFGVSTFMITSFPIEMNLRHAQKSSFSIELHPDEDRDLQQQLHIRNFNKTKLDTPDVSQFNDSIRRAKDHLESLTQNKKRWRDWLSAEIAGPMQPHLTLVDLPGVTQNTNGYFVADGKTLKAITEKYISNHNAIVLVVVDGTEIRASEQVLSLVSTCKAEGRSMGVLTHAGLYPSGSSDGAQDKVNLVRKNKAQLGLGWHVMKDYDTYDSDVNRARSEALDRRFFASGVWSKVNVENAGVAALRQKLRRAVLDSIRKQLPELILGMERQLADCEASLRELGDERDSPREQRGYLSKVLSHLQRLVDAALGARYTKFDEKFFGAAFDARLRDAVNSEMKAFAHGIRAYGRSYLIREDETISPLSVRKLGSSLLQSDSV